MLALATLSLTLNVGTPAPARASRVSASPAMFGFLKELGLEKPDFLPDFGKKSDASAGAETSDADAAPSPVLALAGKGMSLIGPLFTIEAIAQAAVLNLGSYDEAEINAEIDALANSAPCVLLSYTLSPFSVAANGVLESTGCKYVNKPLGLEWFLLGPKASAMRVELRKRYGQGSLPHVWIGGEWVGGLSTGADGGLAGLADRGELVAKLKAARAL